jgi:hypothetical protein
MRDVTANRHETSGGMRWTLSVREMMRANADGQVAWSWSPDAGIKPVDDFHGRRRLTSPVLRREREVSRKPLRRECRIVSACLTILCALLPFSAHKACGCGQRPAFPAPSAFQRDTDLRKTRTLRAAGMRRCGCSLVAAHPSRRAQGRAPHRLRLERVAALNPHGEEPPTGPREARPDDGVSNHEASDSFRRNACCDELPLTGLFRPP